MSKLAVDRGLLERILKDYESDLADTYVDGVHGNIDLDAYRATLDERIAELRALLSAPGVEPQWRYLDISDKNKFTNIADDLEGCLRDHSLGISEPRELGDDLKPLLDWIESLKEHPRPMTEESTYKKAADEIFMHAYDWDIDSREVAAIIERHVSARVASLEGHLAKLLPRAEGCAREARNQGDVKLEMKVRGEIREARAALGGEAKTD